MSRSSVLILVGLLTIFIAFMGIPLTWIRILLPVFGLVVIVIGFLMRSERVEASKREMPTPPVSHEISPIA